MTRDPHAHGGRDAPPDRPYAVIVANPYNGTPAGRARVDALADALGERGLDTRTLWQHEGLDRLVAADCGRNLCRCVIAAGGDGTLNRVINHPLGHAPVAHFPLGNENLFARHFNYPRDPARFADLVLRGRTIDIDTAQSNGRRFTIVTSAGFDGAVAHRLHEARTPGEGESSRRIGRLGYLPPIAATAMRYDFPLIDVEADGRPYRGSLVMAFNLPRYAFGLNLAPDADPTDGLLHYLVFRKPGRLALIRYALATVLGSRHLNLDDVHYATARRLRLIPANPARPAPLETDGDPAGHLPADIAIHPRSLTILAP